MSEGMDRGEFIKGGYSVEPGDGGSFIVIQGGRSYRDEGRMSFMRGFTNYRDLLDWLEAEHIEASGTPTEQPKDSP